MNVPKSRSVTLFKNSILAMLIPACLLSWGCAGVQNQMGLKSTSSASAPKFQAPNVTQQAQTSMGNLEDAAKKDMSSNAAIAKDKFNSMLETNGLAK